MSDLMLDVGQANELKLALRRAGWSNDDIKRLCEGTVLADMLKVLRGHASITIDEHVIDCDVAPFIPGEGGKWTVEEHQKGGQLVWGTSKIDLFLSGGQKNGMVLEGNKLRRELSGKLVLNANVLDHLLANPDLIPEGWKGGKCIFFWGTIYRYRNGDLYVRCLYWSYGRWNWGSYRLDDNWGANDFTVLRAR